MVHLQLYLKETPVNNIYPLVKKSFFSLLAFIALAEGSVQATPETTLCRDTGITLAFFNGVQTTKVQAEVAKQELKRIHGDESAHGEQIKYEVMYNYSNGFEDFVETFEQRLQEQEGLLEGRFELFFEALQGGGI